MKHKAEPTIACVSDPAGERTLFYKAFAHLWQFQGDSSFSTWLTRIAINEALMFLRRIGAARVVSLDDIRDARGSEASLEIPAQILTRKPSARGEKKSGFSRRRFGICARGYAQHSC